MPNHHPISPPLSNDGDFKRSFNEGPHSSNESSFHRPHHIPQSICPDPDVDQAYSYRAQEMENTGLSRGMQQYPQTHPFLHVSQSHCAQLPQLPELPPFRRASQIIAPSMNAGAKDMAEANGDTFAPENSSGPALRPRVKKETRKRKRPKTEVGDEGDPAEVKLNAPLSELTKHLNCTDDTEQYVNRPKEERRREVERKKKGKVPRPMNCFMLYRRAYADRTKELYSQNNHQIVSRVVGVSWRMEPATVRNFFEEMAQIERQNHRKAYPEYKFTPNKNGNPPKRKRGPDLDDENSDFENDDLDDDIMPAAKSLRRNPEGALLYDHSPHSRTPTPLDSSYSGYDSRTSTPLDHSRDSLYTVGEVHKSSWASTNPGRPVPGMLSPPQQNHYYQPSIQKSSLGPGIEDVTYRRMHFPAAIQFDTSAALTGMPGGAPHDFLQPPHTHASTQVSIDGIQVDPQLLQSNGLPIDFTHPASQQQPELWQPFSEEPQQYTHTAGDAGICTPEAGEQYRDHMSYRPDLGGVLGGRELWSEAQVPAGAAEFEDWLNGQTAY